jgi:hypothetical protein
MARCWRSKADPFTVTLPPNMNMKTMVKRWRGKRRQGAQSSARRQLPAGAFGFATAGRTE